MPTLRDRFGHFSRASAPATAETAAEEALLGDALDALALAEEELAAHDMDGTALASELAAVAAAHQAKEHTRRVGLIGDGASSRYPGAWNQWNVQEWIGAGDRQVQTA